MSTRIYRIQAKDGRGPFRPGLTERWIGEPRWEDRPSLMEEFDATDINGRANGRHIGCGFRTMEQLERWFDAEERVKLARLGYVVVTMTADEILAESRTQLVFARTTPLWVGAIAIAHRECDEVQERWHALVSFDDRKNPIKFVAMTRKEALIRNAKIRDLRMEWVMQDR